MKRTRTRRIRITVVITVLLTAALLLGFAFFHHVLPRMKALKAREAAPAPTTTPVPVSAPSPTPEASQEPTPDTRTEWQIRFEDHFTDEVVLTERSYSSPDLAIEITEHRGNFHYGETVYYVADIYMGSIDSFGACLAGGDLTLWYKETIETLAENSGALLAINGDFASYQLSDEYAVTVRNGTVYREGRLSVADICVLFDDGTMETFSPREYTVAELMERGARHIWHFGPKLILADGSVNEKYEVQQAIAYPNPRTAVGYFEPGHYCFVVADGRQDGWSAGLRLEELGAVMVELGCKCAYNLDGGGSSVMYFNGEKINRQSNGGDRECGDALFIAEPAGKGE